MLMQYFRNILASAAILAAISGADLICTGHEARADPGVASSTNPLDTTAANAVVVVRLDNSEGVIGFTITGLTASGATLTIESSNDGGRTWTATSGVDNTGLGSTTRTTDGDFRVDAAGHTRVRLRVSSTGTGSVNVAYLAIPAVSLPSADGSSSVVIAPSTSGLGPTSSTALESSRIFKASSCLLFDFQVNTTTSPGWVLVFNSATVPADGPVTPAKAYQLPANSTLGASWAPAPPLLLGTGCTIVFSTTGPYTKAASATAMFSAEWQ